VSDLLYPYLIGIVSSVILALAAIGAFIYSGRRAVDYMKREARLPEATRWEDLTARVQDLEIEHDRLKEALFDAKKVIEEGERQQGRLNDIEAALRSKEQDYADLQRVQAEYAQIAGQLAADREEVARLTADKSKATFERDALREDSQRIEKRLDEQKNEALRIDERVQQLREAEDGIRQAVGELRTEAGSLRLEVAELNSRRDMLTLELRRLDETKADLQNAVDTLNAESEALLARRSDLATECERLRNKLESQAATLAERAQALDSLGIQLEAALNEVTAAERLRDRLSGTVESLTAERDSLRQQVESLLSDKQTVQKLREEESQLRVKVAELGEQARQKEDRLAELRKEVGSRDPTIADAGLILQELLVPAIAVNEFGDESDEVPSEDQALANVRQHLQDHGLRFSDRVVNAFHTSLKCADETPLLVLAGISGTGKSLLPRRYAEAMGIHFLNAPVQPRWDGPQDLLGFYNYLENRYKATELLRALLQFDRFERSWAPRHEVGDRSAKMHMLIVLLDEMNLARVEYYFSEFLSRLETRRDLDHSNPNDVLKAEIPIDVGRVASTDEDDPVRVFVDTNVMFVGTINEDESTLSLSEKVVDRANIMRFGRPRDLANVPVKDVAQKFRATHPMMKATWNEWIAEGRQRSVDKKYEALIAELNDALDQVGRPFAYRTQRAILAYLGMYPDQSDAGLQQALADQVEQRVLPKLRGVDMNEQAGKAAVLAVADVVKKVGDGELQAAIERGGSQETGHLFVWSGVDRV